MPNPKIYLSHPFLTNVKGFHLWCVMALKFTAITHFDLQDIWSDRSWPTKRYQMTKLDSQKPLPKLIPKLTRINSIALCFPPLHCCCWCNLELGCSRPMRSLHPRLLGQSRASKEIGCCSLFCTQKIFCRKFLIGLKSGRESVFYSAFKAKLKAT